MTLGIYRQFNKDYVFSNDEVSWLYDYADKAKRAANSHPGTLNAVRNKNADNMAAFYSRFNKLAKQEDADSVRSLRQSVLTMLHDFRRAAVDNLHSPAELAVYAVLDAPEDAAACLPSVMDTSVKDGSGVEHALSAKAYLSFQALYNSYFWDAAENALPLCSSHDEARAVLAKIKSIAKDMAVNDTLATLNAPPKPSEERFDLLAACRIPPETFAIASVRAAQIDSLIDKKHRTTIDLSKPALVAEMVDRSFHTLSDFQRKTLLETLNVAKTVAEWPKDKLRQKLESFRQRAA